MALGEKLDFSQEGPLSLVVCGGAALNILGVFARTTRDVDVVALARDEGGEIAFEFADIPPRVRKLASEVGDDLGLGRSWLNTGPSELLRKGLPPGAEARLLKFEFGRWLRVYFLGREDLICLKLYAAASRSGNAQRHFEDLRRLAPDEVSLTRARDWSLTQDETEDFKSELKRVLSNMEHEDLAYGW